MRISSPERPPLRLIRRPCFRASALLVLCFISTIVAADVSQQSLFKIERNKNANIVQYDIVTTEDGRFRKKKPVVAYWVRLAKDGEIRELSWVQKRFAYGFKTKVDKAAESIELDMVADIGRPIFVERAGDAYRAWMQISGEDCFLEKMFIHSSGSGMSTKVNYIEMFGEEKDSLDACYEKLEP